MPDETVNAVVGDHLRQAPTAFVLDGYPLRVSQAPTLEELLHELGTPLDCVVNLHLPEQEKERLIR